MAIQYLHHINLNQNQLLNVALQNLPADPAVANLVEGQIWINTTSHKLKYFDGTNIITIGEITVDSALSSTSTNPVQNKVINTALAGKVNTETGKGLSTNDYTTAEKTKLAGIATGAEVNQNAFSNVKVGSTTVAADGKTDTLELAAGTNITLTPDATNDKVTISASEPVANALKTNLQSSSIDGGKLSSVTEGSATIIHYGECSSGAGTAQKTVALDYFTLVTGSKVAIKFTVTNTVSPSNISLKVGNSDAKSIKYRGANLPSPDVLTAGRIYEFVYDGTNWELIGDLDTNTTYSAGTTSLITTGTDTSNRVWQAKILHDYIASVVGAVDAMRFKGTVSQSSPLPTSNVKVGDTYMVNEAGTYAGQTCEVGDLIIATATTPTWTVAQTNIAGAITSISNGTGISVSGSGSSRTIALASGVATAGSKGDTSNQTPSWGGTFKVTSETIDTYGRTTALAEHTVKIPNATATTSAAGLMSAADKTKLNQFAGMYKASNPALTSSGGVCTWDMTVPFDLNTNGLPLVQLYDMNANQVMADISMADATTLRIKIISSSTITADSYFVVAIA